MRLNLDILNKEQFELLFGFLVTVAFKIKSWSYDCSVVNYPKTNCIFALWHSRQCGLYGLLERKKTYCLISKSREGGIIAKAAQALGLKTLRGSHRRGGTQASLEMLDILKEGNNAAITIDGPRGPKEVVKKGVVEIAKLSQVPIVPFAWWGPSKGFIKLKTWDEFCYPLFAKKLAILCGDPIYVDKNADEDEIERIRKQIEEKLKQLDKDLRENFNKYYKTGAKKQII